MRRLFICVCFLRPRDESNIRQSSIIQGGSGIGKNAEYIPHVLNRQVGPDA